MDAWLNDWFESCLQLGGDPKIANMVREEFKRLRQQVNDLQSGMWVNCVYCGHRYGPRESTAATLQEAGTNMTMAEALTKHIESCPEHPMSKLKLRVKELESQVKNQHDLIADMDHLVMDRDERIRELSFVLSRSN